MTLLALSNLHEMAAEDFGIVPAGFLDNLPEGKYFVYLASCDESGLIFMEPSPEEITGFTLEEMIAGGTDMQISRIHPDDISGLYDKALRIIQKNSAATQQGKRTIPMVLQYRIKRADGEWREFVETKIFRYLQNGHRDRVLGKVVDITEQASHDRLRAQQFLSEPGNDYPFLNSLDKFKKNPVISEGIGEITKREKEILYLIGAGFSTKQIASQLFISINTVQTHRSNLLRKLQVKNSMELIREVSKAFWL